MSNQISRVKKFQKDKMRKGKAENFPTFLSSSLVVASSSTTWIDINCVCF